MVTKNHHGSSMASSSSLCPPSRRRGAKNSTVGTKPPPSLSQSAVSFGTSYYDAQPKKHPDWFCYVCYVRPRLLFIMLLLLTGSCDGMKNTTTHHVLPVNNVVHPMDHENSLHDTYDDHRLVAATEKTLIEHDRSRLLKQECVYNQRDFEKAIRLKRTHIDLCSSNITIKSTISAVSTLVNVTCSLKITNGVKCMLDAQGLTRHFRVFKATLSFYDIVFNNGYTKGYGGAIYIDRSRVSMYRCDFMNNSAKYGGAIASDSSTLILRGGEAEAAVAENNEANYGGFLYALNSSIDISNHLFRNNSAVEVGGAIYIDQSSTLSTYRCDFRNNSAVYGGAIYSLVSTLILTGGEAHAAVVENNQATSDAYSSGGFIIAYQSTISITNHLFLNNSAQYGGAIDIEQSSTLSTYRCDFIHNYANYKGGAIYSSDSTLILTGGEALAGMAENNKATNGGFLVALWSIINITNHLFLSNDAAAYGGAIDIEQSSTLSAYRCDFMNNSAKHGGAISSFDSTLILTGGEATPAVAENNKAKNYGGFLSAWSSMISITNHLFLNNSAAKGVAGANLHGNGTSYYENVVFQNNSASQGGALVVIFDDIALRNVVFKINNATNGTIRSYSSQIDLKNYSFLSSDPTMDTCDLFVSQFRETLAELLVNHILKLNDGLYLASCINFPTLIAINNRRLDTKSIQAHSHEHSTIFDPNDQTYPSDHLFSTTTTSIETHLSMPHNRSSQRLTQCGSVRCVTSKVALESAVRLAKPECKATIKLCTPVIKVGSHARRLQYGNSNLLTNRLDGIDISNKNIVFVCSRKRRGKAHRCTLDAGGNTRHFYGSNAKVQFHNIRFINGYHQGAGGALLINNSDVTLTSCSFSNNTALSGAGAVFVNQTRFIINGTGTNVSQNGGSGAPIEIHSSNATVQNVVFADNTMSQFGDGIFVFKSDVDVSNLSFNQSSSKMSSNCSLFVSVNPTKRSKGATCVAL